MKSMLSTGKRPPLAQFESLEISRNEKKKWLSVPYFFEIRSDEIFVPNSLGFITFFLLTTVRGTFKEERDFAICGQSVRPSANFIKAKN